MARALVDEIDGASRKEIERGGERREQRGGF